MALTATATPAVQKDIQSNLGMRAGTTDRWVQSFERPNLHFSVRSKHSDVLANFRELMEAHGKGEAMPTIIYTISRKYALPFVTPLPLPAR
jgi:superfamily II DNA helicase RecQ